MTTKQRNDSHSTEFGLWLRNQRSLDSRLYGFDGENLDYVWFAYRDGWVITIEEKRHGAAQAVPQRDTHSIINQMLQYASNREYLTMRGKRKIEYRGYYLIQFENTTPDDSQWIKINGHEYTSQELLFLLRFGQLISLPPLSLMDMKRWLSRFLQQDVDIATAFALAKRNDNE
jgi:hypothetical protein